MNSGYEDNSKDINESTTQDDILKKTEKNNYLNIFEMDYENTVLKVYHFDLNKNDYKKLGFTLEYDYCSDKVSKKYNMTFCFE